MLNTLESTRRYLSSTTDAARKSRLGQFFTPASTAAFMASLFPVGHGECRLLDAGAGIGSLSAAFLQRWRRGAFGFHCVRLDAFEIDTLLHPALAQTLDAFAADDFHYAVRGDDFVLAASEAMTGDLFGRTYGPYTHVILNPPYRKIHSQSPHRLALRRAGIETGNLYSAFVALALSLTAPGGQLVAILPRSFCNGPYYRAFREFILTRAAIRRVHLFGSRTQAFRDDDVLQENLIVHLERGGVQGEVLVSTSADDGFDDLELKTHAYARIVHDGDAQRVIHIPEASVPGNDDWPAHCRHSLVELGLAVSTGPVVDFRVREHLREQPGLGDVPLLYPSHFVNGELIWPRADKKKPNALARNVDTERALFPVGHYCVVRRLSSKEEPRRIVASVVAPQALRGAALVGFENHLNVVHARKRGLSEALTRGLAGYLNSALVDRQFRRFSGHTQVNATDLRRLQYPDAEWLTALGKWMAKSAATPDLIEARIACQDA
jgi:adenine-specific DNA-methyltransferase